MDLDRKCKNATISTKSLTFLLSFPLTSKYFNVREGALYPNFQVVSLQRLFVVKHRPLFNIFFRSMSNILLKSTTTDHQAKSYIFRCMITMTGLWSLPNIFILKSVPGLKLVPDLPIGLACWSLEPQNLEGLQGV